MATSRSKTGGRRAAPRSWLGRRRTIDIVAVVSVLVLAVGGILYDPGTAPVPTTPRVKQSQATAKPSNAKPAGPLKGVASVIDGDTLEIHETRIRLFAIDAPESEQVCQDDEGVDWPCGRQAARALSDKIGRSTVTCDAKTKDRHGRIIATCWLGSEDLGRWMVIQGLAMAYRQFGLDYVADEDRAMARRIGIWGGSFQEPWVWRKDH